MKYNFEIDSDAINEMIKSRYTENSDVSDLIINNEKEMEDFIWFCIENTIYPPSTSKIEQEAFMLGQKYHK